MLTAEQVLDAYFLDNRSMLLEIAATLDRLDAAAERAPGSVATDRPCGARCPSAPVDPRLEKIYNSLAILADRSAPANRAEQLLVLFSDPVD